MQQTNKTPGRRRRNTRSTPAQKQYASENDAASAVPFPTDYPSTPARTASGTPTENAPGTQPRTGRTSNKQQQKNLAQSPAPAENGRPTPPASVPPNKGAPGAAYAGATFHASPAPNSLPIPSFLAKSPMARSGMVSSREASASGSESDGDDIHSPSKRLSTRLAREESPLDFMFQADREEKDRSRGVSASAGKGPFQPPLRQQNLSPVGNPAQPRQQRGTPMRTGDIFAGHQSDGYDGPSSREMRHTTPYNERMRAAMTPDKSRPPHLATNGPSRAQAGPSPPSTQDRSDALKNFLWGGLQNPASPSNVAQHAPQQARAAPPNSMAMPATPQTQSSYPYGDRKSSVTALEDNLRRALKLDSPSNAGLPNGRLA